MLCIVRLSANEANKAEDAARKGADALIIDGGDASKVKDFAKKTPNLVLGVRPPKTERGQVASLREAGADFVILDAESGMADALLEEKIGFVLLSQADSGDTRLRLLAELNLDALIPPPLDGSLTIERLLELRRVSALARTPLFVEVSGDPESSRLQALRESGVAGVIIEGSAMGKLAKLREAIAALPARGKKREERSEATIPAATMAGHDHDHDDDFDDD
jgi:2-methylisocitrate lyase-like PEP mutase family enzyme